YPNIMTHLTAMNALNFAVAHGVKVKEEVRYKSESYAQSMLKLRDDWSRQTDGCLLPAVVAALYGADQAYQKLLGDMRAGKAAGGDEAPLRVMETHALEVREELRTAVEQLNAVKLRLYGPALDAMPEALKAERDLSPEDADKLEEQIRK